MDKFIFGITGATGAGKSTVSKLFRDLGVYVADADKASRAVTQKGSQCLLEICHKFGSSVITKTGELDRKALGKIVFNDKEKLQLLNNITHKYIKSYLENEIANSTSPIAAIDGAVIIGSPVMDMCKLMVVVIADTATRIERITKRDNIDKKTAQMRVASQMTNEEYCQYADYIIENNDEINLGECVEKIYNKIENISKK